MLGVQKSGTLNERHTMPAICIVDESAVEFERVTIKHKSEIESWLNYYGKATALPYLSGIGVVCKVDGVLCGVVWVDLGMSVKATTDNLIINPDIPAKLKAAVADALIDKVDDVGRANGAAFVLTTANKAMARRLKRHGYKEVNNDIPMVKVF